MPTYRVEIPGQGNFRVESETDLTDEQAYEYALRSMASEASEAGETGAATNLMPVGGQEGFTGPSTVQEPELPAGQGYFQRLGRRLTESAADVRDLPWSAAGIVTGGPEDSRLLNLVRTLQGIGAPVTAALSPATSAVEHAGEGLGLTPKGARMLGDVSEIPMTMGLGMLAGAGKLTKAGQQLAHFIGVGKPQSFEEAIKSDPMLRFSMLRREKTPTQLTHAQTMAELGRTSAKPSEIALAANSQALAEALLRRERAHADEWFRFAQENQIVGDMIPPEPRITRKQLIEFQEKRQRGAMPWTVLGTPSRQVLALDEKAGYGVLEANLTEMGIQAADTVREQRNLQAIMGSGEQTIADSLRYWQEGYKLDEVLKLPPQKLNVEGKRLFKFFTDKFDIDKGIIIPKLREQNKSAYRTRVKNQLAREGREMPDDAIETMTEQLLLKELPDGMSTDHIPNLLMPGNWKVIVNDVVVGTADSQLGAKMLIKEAAEAGAKREWIRAEGKTLMDGDQIHYFKDSRFSKAMEKLAEKSQMSNTDIAQAMAGDYFPALGKANHWLSPFKDWKGQNYTKGLLESLKVYDKRLERFLQMSELRAKTSPIIRNVTNSGRETLADIIKTSVDSITGYRSPLGEYVDNFLTLIPGVRSVVAPFFIERLAGHVKNGLAFALLKANPRYHMINAGQLASTTLGLSGGHNLLEGIKLWNTAHGAAILKRHGVSDPGTILGLRGDSMAVPLTKYFTKDSRGISFERNNQQIAFLTFYNMARKWGITDSRAAAWAKLKGPLQTQFVGLTSDQPHLFNKADLTYGVATMFQRYPIKQLELLFDMVKDRNFPGAAKWLTVNLALGGMKSATLGGGGWLTLALYNQIAKEYGTTVADTVHVGLPSLIGLDISNSVMAYNPPYGDSLPEAFTNLVAGPVYSLSHSTIGAALEKSAPEPSAYKRAFNAFAAQTAPGRMVKSLTQLYQGDYDFRDPLGRLRWQGQMTDVMKQFFSFNPSYNARIDTAVKALFEIESMRDEVVNYAASRQGQALLGGISLGREMETAIQHELDAWNAIWPEFPITQSELRERAERRAQVASQTLMDRVLRQAPTALRQSGSFKLPPGGG